MKNEVNEILYIAKQYRTIKSSLDNRISEYCLDELRKFNDDFIEFDSNEKNKFIYRNQIVELDALSVDFYNSAYVVLHFTTEDDAEIKASLSEMTTEDKITIMDIINDYVEKYGYRNSNDM